MSNRLNVAMVGCGGLPTDVLLPALSLVEEVRLVATCDLRDESAQRAAERFHAPRFYTDYRMLLDRERLDGILIAAPPAVHVEVGIEALNRGLHVYSEKPPAITAADAKRFRDASVGKLVKTLVGTVQRHCPVNRMAKDLLSKPEFGNPLVYQARYICPGPGMRMDWGMRRDSDNDMFRFFLLDHGIHHIDLARFFMGDIETVYAMRSRTASEQYAAVVHYRFASGIVGSQTFAFRSPVFENRSFIAGDGPAWVETHNWTKLTYAIPDLPVGTGGYNDGRVVTWDGGISYQNGVVRPGYREELTAWARAILDDTECRANLDDAYREMLVIDAIVESLKKNREIQLTYD